MYSDLIKGECYYDIYLCLSNYRSLKEQTLAWSGVLWRGSSTCWLGQQGNQASLNMVHTSIGNFTVILFLRSPSYFSFSDRIRLLLTKLVLKGSLVLSFDSSAVLDMSGVALLTMLIHAEMVKPADVYQFLNLTTLAARNCSQVIVATVIDSEPDSAGHVNATATDSALNLTENVHNSTDVLRKSLSSTVIQGTNPNVTSDLTNASDYNAFWSDVWSFLSSCWDVLADILHQLGQVLMDPQPTAPFVVVALTSLLCFLAFCYLLWRFIRNLYRLMKWLCCLCRPQVSDDLPPPAAQQTSDPDLELANLSQAFVNIAQEQPPFSMDLQVEVEAANESDPPAPLAVPEEFHYIPAPPPPPSSPSMSIATTMV